MTDVEFQILRDTVGLPVLLSGVGLAAARWLSGRWPKLRGPAIALTIAVAWSAAEIAIRGSSDYWPTDLTRRLPHAAMLVVAASLLQAAISWRGMAWLLSALVAAAVAVSLAQSGATYDLNTGQKVLWGVVVGALFFVSQCSFEGLAARGHSWLPPLIWGACAAVSAVLLAASGSLSFAQICGALAVTLAVLLAFTIKWPGMRMEQGPAELVAVLLVALLAAGHLFSELPLVSALLAAAAPHSLWLAQLPRLRTRPVFAAILALLVSFTLLGGAAWGIIANRAVEEEAPADTSSNPYYNM